MAQPMELSGRQASAHQPSRVVEHAVGHGFHARGAAGFQGPARGVEPDVAALDQVAGDFHVVVFQEDQVVAAFLGGAELHQLLDDFFAFVVLGVGLAGEDELDGPRRVVDDFDHPLLVLQEHVGAFVGGEASGEADGQGLGIEDLFGELQFAAFGAPGDELVVQAAADEVHQAFAQPFVGAPEFGVGDGFGLSEDARAIRIFAPVSAEVAVVERGHVLGDPGGHVHAVGDGADGHVFGRVLRPDAPPHGARDRAVELGDAVVEAREPQRQDGHAEGFGFVARVFAAQRQKDLVGQAQFARVVLEIGGHEFRREAVVSGRDRGMGGEHARGGHQFQGGFEGELVDLHEVADALQADEGGVALVHVDDLGAKAERGQGADAADAEQDFLPQAHFQAAAVEAGGDLPEMGRVFRDIGVEQVESDPADQDSPYLGLDLLVGQFDGDGQAFAVFVHDPGHGPLFEVGDGVAFLLPAVRGEILAEVALLVTQAEADQRQAQVRGAFQVVAGQDAESPGVHGQADGDAVFQAEIGHHRFLGFFDREGDGGGFAGKVAGQRAAQGV